jgi:hypothetical protein
MLLHDELHDFPGYFSSPSRCRVRLCLPAEGSGQDTYIVILTDDQKSHGTSITNAIESTAGPLCRKFNIPPERTVFIEHYDCRHLPGGHDEIGRVEDFTRVEFLAPEAVQGRFEYIHGLILGTPKWTPTDKQSVEMLIDERLP